MEIMVHDPEATVYPTSGDYVHAIAVRDPGRLVFVSGTMGLRPDGTPGVDLEQQLALVWSNIAAILGDAGASLDDVVRVTSYLTDPSSADANARARRRALGGRLVPTTAIVVRTLEDSWLVEIEVVAATP
ncbi:MAG: RidA family protein [Actinomycetota bacterium]|nr:RidA family protein [Actinomycetota bacterium]